MNVNELDAVSEAGGAEETFDPFHKLVALLGNVERLIIAERATRPEDSRLLFGPNRDQQILRPRFKIEIFDDGALFTTE